MDLNKRQCSEGIWDHYKNHCMTKENYCVLFSQPYLASWRLGVSPVNMSIPPVQRVGRHRQHWGKLPARIAKLGAVSAYLGYAGLTFMTRFLGCSGKKEWACCSCFQRWLSSVTRSLWWACVLVKGSLKEARCKQEGQRPMVPSHPSDLPLMVHISPSITKP